MGLKLTHNPPAAGAARRTIASMLVLIWIHVHWLCATVLVAPEIADDSYRLLRPAPASGQGKPQRHQQSVMKLAGVSLDHLVSGGAKNVSGIVRPSALMVVRLMDEFRTWWAARREGQRVFVPLRILSTKVTPHGGNCSA